MKNIYLSFLMLFFIFGCGEESKKLRVVSNIENGIVYIDEQEVGEIRIGYGTYFVSSGEHDIEVRKNGKDGEWIEVATQKVTIGGEKTTVIELETKKVATNQRKERLAKLEKERLAQEERNRVRRAELENERLAQEESSKVRRAELENERLVRIAKYKAEWPNLCHNYIKITIDSGFNYKEVQLSEIKFFQETTEVPVTVKNYSSEYHDKKWSHKKIVDGDINTSWANADSHDNEYPHWFVLTPNNSNCADISKVSLYTGTQDNHEYRLSTFNIYASSDKKKWVHLISGELDKSSSNRWISFDLDPKFVNK